MSAVDPSGPLPPRPPAPVARRWGGAPWVWTIPVIAVIIAAWLGMRALAERGPTITIDFATGDGIEAGRTTIRFKSVALGHVTRLAISPDNKKVIVTAEMRADADPLLRSGTEFWVVRPRVGLSGISGLNTLVSGAYIGLLPGTGETGAREFTGLETPPPQQGLKSGQSYVLTTKSLPSVSDEAPVYYHGVKVGEVTGHELSDRDGNVVIHIFIYDPHEGLIRTASRFWVSSGFQVTADAQGIKLGTESLRSLLIGGIVFDTPKWSFGKPQSKAGATFTLYGDAKAAADAADPLRVSYRLHFPGSLHGLAVGAPVELRGIQIGRVSAVRLEYDTATDTVRVPVTIAIAPHDIHLPGKPPLPATDEAGAVARTNKLLEHLIAKGLRARLVSGSLLTGGRVVELDFVDNAPPATLAMTAPEPEIPTAPGSGLEEMTQSATSFLDKLAALPLGDLVDQVRDMVHDADAVVAAPEIKRSLRSLDRTLANAARLTHKVQTRIGPLLTKLNTAGDELNATLALLGNDPRSSVDLARTMAELKDAARSVRVLADYLERHPESLIGGKPGGASR